MIDIDRNLSIFSVSSIQFFNVDQLIRGSYNVPGLQIFHISRFCYSDCHCTIIRRTFWQKIFITRFHFDSVQSFSR